MQFKKQKTKRVRSYTCSKYFKRYFSLMQHRRAKNSRIRLKFWLKNSRTSRFPKRLPYKEKTSLSIPFMGIHDVIVIKGSFKLLRGIAYKYKSFIFYFTLSSNC